MRFLVDECTGPSVARWLREQGHDVFSVFEQARGLDDDAIMEIASLQDRIVITSDKEFGTRAVRDRQVPAGILLMRLRDERTPNKLRVLEEVLRNYGDRLEGNLIVASEVRIRIIPLHKDNEP